MTFMAEPNRELPMTPQNFDRGFLIDDQWMAGVTPTEQGFLAYVIDIESGERLGSHLYPTVEAALETFSQMNRAWIFESTSGCSGGSCGTSALGDADECHVKGGACTRCGACDLH